MKNIIKRESAYDGYSTTLVGKLLFNSVSKKIFYFQSIGRKKHD